MSAPTDQQIVDALRHLAQGDEVIPPLEQDPVAIMLGLVNHPIGVLVTSGVLREGIRY